jgi:sphingomyelin phosphodiesterase 2
MDTQSTPDGQPPAVSSIHILTLNCWGLKYLSKYRQERLSEIGNRLASYAPQLDIVGLQECWTYHDYLSIRDSTRSILPYGKFYHSGIFGGGLVILSRWPITDSSMHRYPLNGRPQAFFRGDWFVGKGVACAKIELPDGVNVEVFNTHLHAPYEREPNDSYICHRTAQAWEIAKLMRAASDRGSLVIGLGDFNMVPLSFAHVLIETRAKVHDVWRLLKPASSIGASIDPPEIARRKRLNEEAAPNVDASLQEHGHTCDSVMNTWRWDKAHQKQLTEGKDRKVLGTDLDPRAKRLDYIFLNGAARGWKVAKVEVALTERHPTLLCSLSDHFAVQATVERGHVKVPQVDDSASRPALDKNQRSEKDVPAQIPSGEASQELYQDILRIVETYKLRERRQRRYGLIHFVGAALTSIGCFVAVWWSPRNFVAFILILLSTFGIMAGTIHGLIGGLFVGSELRALGEFEWEVRNALHLAGGPSLKDETTRVRDWYD